jgi:hypothetical protein
LIRRHNGMDKTRGGWFPIDMDMLDDRDVVSLLRCEVERAGGQSSWARRERIDRTTLNRVLGGRKRPTEQIIRALKLCNRYAFDAIWPERAHRPPETEIDAGLQHGPRRRSPAWSAR